MSDMPTNKHLRFLLKLFYLLFGLAVAYLVYKYMIRWLLPFILSFLVACAIQKPVHFLHEKFRFPPKFGCLVMVFFTYGIVGAIAVGLIYWFISELSAFISTLPALLADLPEVVSGVYGNITRYLGRFSNGELDLVGSLSDLLSKITSASVDMSSVFGTVKNVAFSIPTILIFIIALFVGTYYFASDYVRIREFILAQVPEKIQESAGRLIHHLFKTLGNWCKAVSIMMLITFVELLIGFLLMRLDYAAVLAVAIAILDALPVFGVGTILIPWSLYSLLTGAYMRALYLALLYVIIVIVRNSLEPKILGTRIGLNPLLMLICLYLGYVTMGLLGMFILPICLIAIERLQAWGYIHIYNMPESMRKQAQEDIPDPVETIKETIKQKKQNRKSRKKDK